MIVSKVRSVLALVVVVVVGGCNNKELDLSKFTHWCL